MASFIEDMTLDNDFPMVHPERFLWMARGFQWLQERRKYHAFDIDSCLNILKENISREAAFAAFWSTYLTNELQPHMTDEQHGKLNQILEHASAKSSGTKDMQDIAFVKLHLASLLAISLIRPDSPICKNPSLVTILEKSISAYELAEPPKINIDEPENMGKELIEEDLLGFSILLTGGVVGVELALVRAEQRRYEEALNLMSRFAWDICATTIRPIISIDIIEGTHHQDVPEFLPYLPHSGCEFKIQEAVDIFEEIKAHGKDIKDWSDIQNSCDVLRYLGLCGLYDPNESFKPFVAEGVGAIEYWGRAATFAEEQMRVIA